jgi:hypothetical protein
MWALFLREVMRYPVLVLTVALIAGCANSQEPKIFREWNNVETTLGVLGTWAGVTSEGDVIKYVFNKDSSCMWVIGIIEIPCKFGGKKQGDGIRLVIYEIEGKQFKNVEFLAWLKVNHDKMMIYGYPTRNGRLQSGEKASWPTSFTEDSLLLTYERQK